MMTRYAQLSGDTILLVIESETDPDGTNGAWVACGDAGPGWITTDGGITFAPPPAPIVTERSISGLAYLRRFTQSQRIAVRELAKTDAIAQDLMHLLDSTIAQGGQINLMDQDTVNGANYLAAMLPAQSIDPSVILA